MEIYEKKTIEKFSKNVTPHNATISRYHREQQNGHGSMLLWFTGFSGAGKSTLAHAVEEKLYKLNYKTYVLDGDNVRQGLCGDLEFSEKDRKENIRRIGEVGKLFVDAGIITLAAFISPFRMDRDRVRELLGEDNFVEIYCKASLKVCEQRDVKGIYKKARNGLIKEFTGISSPYEEPERPELVIDTGTESLDKSVQIVLDFLAEKRRLKVS